MNTNETQETHQRKSHETRHDIAHELNETEKTANQEMRDKLKPNQPLSHEEYPKTRNEEMKDTPTTPTIQRSALASEIHEKPAKLDKLPFQPLK